MPLTEERDRESLKESFASNGADRMETQLCLKAKKNVSVIYCKHLRVVVDIRLCLG